VDSQTKKFVARRAFSSKVKNLKRNPGIPSNMLRVFSATLITRS